jgi:hypothetical protein
MNRGQEVVIRTMLRFAYGDTYYVEVIACATLAPRVAARMAYPYRRPERCRSAS